MALVKPIALAKNAFDATKDEIFYFTVSGGAQIVKNKIVVRLQSDNTIVYSGIETTYRTQHTIPANTLSNGNYYNYYINTYDTDGNESVNSNVISFYCYTTPTVEITNLTDGDIVENTSFIFNIRYNQEQGELLDFLSVNLYSSSGQLIKTSENMYSGDTPPTIFNYTIGGLENNTIYKVQVNATSVNGTLTSSALVSFDVIYSRPALYSSFDITNKCNDGYVQLHSNIVIVNGISNVDPMIYIDNSRADIRFPWEYIKWNQGYGVAQDFIISLWVKPTWTYRFFEMSPSNEPTVNGYIMKFVREIPYGETTVKDYFELYGYKDSVLTVYQRSNYVDIMTTNDYVLVGVKKVGTTYTLVLQVITKGDTDSITWNDSNNVEYNTMTDISWENETYTSGIQPTLLNGDMDSIFPCNDVTVYSEIYDNLDITKDVTKTISSTMPEWDYNTELDCNFNNNINGGNTNMLLSQLTAIKIKRRLYGTYDWLTIYEKDINTIDDLLITTQDPYIPVGQKFQWALVPVLTGGIEGNYVIQDLTPQFNGVFISNKKDNIYKLYDSVVYGTGTQNIRLGQLQPIGTKYPILIQNGAVNNYSNTITANLYGYNFETTRTIDRADVIQQANDLSNLLIKGNSFCITDWNGNIWIAKINAAPTFVYNSAYGNGIITITLSFVEQGKYDNQSDMKNNGLINIETD